MGGRSDKKNTGVATQKYLEKAPRERNVHGKLQVGLHIQPEEDGSGSTKQNWMKTSGLWLCSTGSDKV